MKDPIALPRTMDLHNEINKFRAADGWRRMYGSGNWGRETPLHVWQRLHWEAWASKNGRNVEDQKVFELLMSQGEHTPSGNPIFDPGGAPSSWARLSFITDMQNEWSALTRGQEYDEEAYLKWLREKYPAIP